MVQHEAFIALQYLRQRNAEMWAEQIRSMQCVTFDMSRAEVDDHIHGMRAAARVRIEASGNTCTGPLLAIQTAGKTTHQTHIDEIERFLCGIKALQRMAKTVREFQQLAMNVVKDNWRDTRMNQLAVVRDAITEVIRDREDQRKGVRETHDLSMVWEGQSHRLYMDTRVQSHVKEEVISVGKDLEHARGQEIEALRRVAVEQE